MTLWTEIKEFFKPLTDKLEWFGKKIQKIVNCLLLLIVYFTSVAFTSILAKIIAKKFLDLKPDKNKSYWIEEESITLPKDEYYRMF
ncbi:hypothetical protein COV11_00435 [Candidatus Woesearchaeota archaeon CG10_big_fil_rev_8_21_14_0_10_30_7]|nr:MAG: hypothetical protein COV11_00435 [Candidatus Woesearchaeota archaeon CG10_big_fil_rev_8_21_14_0_10_30_7]